MAIFEKKRTLYNFLASIILTVYKKKKLRKVKEQEAEVEAKAHEGRSLAEAMPNEAEAQEEVLENEKRGQNIKGQNLNPAGNTCGLALLGQIR